jgi:hypothetical protein
MRPTILLILLILSSSLMAQSHKLPWADNCVRVVTLKGDLKLSNSYTQYNWFGGMWAEIEQLMATLMKKERVQISLEYLNYRSGNLVTNIGEYAADCNSFTTDESDDPEVAALHEKSQAGTLTLDDFKGPKWIHMIQPIDTEEANCLALSHKNGVLAGCADL